MRYVGSRLDQIPVLPDTVLSVLLTAATGQAFDYPTGTDVFRVTAGCTAPGGAASVFFNPASTGAVLPTTAGTVTTATTGHNIPITPGAEGRLFQRPRASTGFSVICGSSLSVSVEFWSRAGTT